MPPVMYGALAGDELEHTTRGRLVAAAAAGKSGAPAAPAVWEHSRACAKARGRSAQCFAAAARAAAYYGTGTGDNF